MTDQPTFGPNERVLNAYKRWTMEEEALLWRNRHLPIEALVTLLGRKDSSIRQRLERLGIPPRA